MFHDFAPILGDSAWVRYWLQFNMGERRKRNKVDEKATEATEATEASVK